MSLNTFYVIRAPSACSITLNDVNNPNTVLLTPTGPSYVLTGLFGSLSVYNVVISWLSGQTDKNNGIYLRADVGGANIVLTNNGDSNNKQLYYVGVLNPQTDILASDASSQALTKGWLLLSSGQQLTATIPSGHYFGVLSVRAGNSRSVDTFSNLSTVSVCLGGHHNVLMGDGSLKCLKDLCRGDVVLGDQKTVKLFVVNRLLSGGSVAKWRVNVNGVELIGSYNHPVWLKDNVGRVCLGNIEGAELLESDASLYNLQFDDEGSFYVDGLKVDSVSPYNHHFRLLASDYLDVSKYLGDDCVILDNENDSFRMKPFFDDKRRVRVSELEIL